jgi:hypothetical protein
MIILINLSRLHILSSFIFRVRLLLFIIVFAALCGFYMLLLWNDNSVCHGDRFKFVALGSCVISSPRIRLHFYFFTESLSYSPIVLSERVFFFKRLLIHSIRAKFITLLLMARAAHLFLPSLRRSMRFLKASSIAANNSDYEEEGT